MSALNSPWFRTIIPLLGCLIVAILVLPLSAAADDRLERLPEKYRKWLEEEVVYIIAPEERDAFLDLQAVEEWDAFINAFWRRRDPDPITPVNEFKEEHYRRIEFANRTLGRESAVPGWMTDRGKMLIILGDPDDRETFVGIGWLYPTEVWFYMQNNEKNLPPLYLLFFRNGNAGPYILYNHLLHEPADLMPAQRLDLETARAEGYDILRDVSPDLAHASITMRADRGPFAGINNPDDSSLETLTLISEIEHSPFRRVDTSYVDAAGNARGLVESEYLFNYIPNAGMANVLPGPADTRFVHYSIEIEPQHMTMAKDENNYYTSFELKGEVTTKDTNKTVLQFTKQPDMTITESQFRDVNYRPFAYRDMFPIIPGDYLFRLVLKNRARSEYTIFETELQVPQAPQGSALFDPVLLYGLGETSGPEAEGAYRTYQLGKLRLEPNSKRVYTANETLLAHVPLENMDEDNQLSFRIVNREDPGRPNPAGQPAREPEPLTVKVGSYKGAPIVELMKLAGLAGGRYRLEVDLLDPAGSILESRYADFDITPRTKVLRPWVMRDSVDGTQTGVARAALAEQYVHLGEISLAKEASQQALKDDPNLTTPRLILARIQLDEKNPVEAIKLLEPAYAQNQGNVEILLTLGDAHFEAKSYERAAELFEAALVLRRPDASLLNALAVSLAQVGETQKAVDYLERSLELDPGQEATKSLLEKLKSSSSPQL